MGTQYNPFYSIEQIGIFKKFVNYTFMLKNKKKKIGNSKVHLSCFS